METIKQWILKRPFVFHYVQDQIKGAESAFATRLMKHATDDVLETMKEDLEERAEELSKQKLNDLLSPVDLHKIVTLDKTRGMIYIGGERAEDTRLANLHAEAEFLLQSDIWSLLQESPRELAQRQMFVSGETLADLQKGKSILYTLSAQKNIVETFKSYSK